jgi:pyruvate dehydrogenase E2 component (dihydrolipoamide acetyltransferase)
MAVPLIMPKLEMSQETATVIEWMRHEGDSVKKGEALLTVETDKVTVEVESPASGVLAAVRAGSNQVVPVTEVIAYILEPGEALPPEAAMKSPPDEKMPAAGAPVAATPVAQRMAADRGIDLGKVRGSGPGGRIGRADVAAYLDKRGAELETPPGKVRAVPAARRLARELNVDLGVVSGTGPGDRIQSKDVQRAADMRSAAAQPLSAGPVIRRQIPLTGMRRTIAERMLHSVRQAPQFTVTVDVDMSQALDVVDDLRDGLERLDGPRVTLTTFLVKACSWALARHPALNATLEGDVIIEFAEVNIGVAVAVEAGLIVPVIHQADQLEIRTIAERLSELTTRAQQGRLSPDDVQGGTFTLSNLGMFGIDSFTAILNPPQAGILAVGSVSKRPVVQEDQVVIRPMATFSLTADHRVVDGALASRFLAELRAAIERPGIML